MSWCFSFILKIENPESVAVWRLLLLWWLWASHAECHQLVSVKKYFQPRKILSGQTSQLTASHKSECFPRSFVTMQKHVMLLNMISLWIIYSIFARIHPLEQLRSQFKAVGLIENEMARLKGPSVRSSDFHPTHGAESGSADVFVNMSFQDNCAAIKGRIIKDAP